MNITDEQLSAFLDNELPEQEANSVRDAIAMDEGLTDRLAALSMVDHVVKQSVNMATCEPIPSHIVALLEPATVNNANLFDLSEHKKQRRRLHHIAMAASVGLAFVLGWQQLNSHMSDSTSWEQVAHILDTKQSGVAYNIDSQVVTPQLSFVNHNGEYCRQFVQTNADQKQAIIACKSQAQWEVVASASLSNSDTHPASEYTTASNRNALDHEIDTLISGAPLNATQEQTAITQQWQPVADRGGNHE